jgi:hypothetical protein
MTKAHDEMIKKLRKFVKIRNNSGFHSNLQFGFDLVEAGLSMEDMPQAQKIAENHYVWDFECGRLTELYGVLQFQEKGEYVSS